MAVHTPDVVSVHEARKKLGDHVLAAMISDKTTTLTYHGKPAALIVPIPDV
jgi:prevent-host-death family protein